MAYTTTATTKGGRNGRAVLENGGLGLAMALPKEMGGSSEGHNPEQLFALGWSSCFGQAILALSKKHGIDGQDARVTCTIAIDKDDISFALKSELKVSIPGADKAKVQALVEDAHKICPYSRATRGNVPVTLTVV
jgi:osmotically inducible protein OsmC